MVLVLVLVLVLILVSQSNTVVFCRYWKREHFSAIEHLKKLLVEHHPNEDISVRKSPVVHKYAVPYKSIEKSIEHLKTLLVEHHPTKNEKVYAIPYTIPRTYENLSNI